MDDGAGNQMREKHHEKGEITQADLAGGAAAEIDEQGDLLERIKRNAERQQNLRHE